jgi:hypothetical protein
MDNINLNFTDLTEVGYSQPKMGLSKGLEDAAFNMPGGPDKINFYNQLATDDEKQTFMNLMQIYNKEKARVERIDQSQDEILRLLKKEWRKLRRDKAGVAKPVTLSESLASTGATSSLTTDGGGGMKGGGLIDYMQDWNRLKHPSPKDDPSYTKEDLVDDFEEDPVFSPKVMEIGAIDRVIFIVGTYIIRAIILFMIEWGINSYMITTFQQCFTTYAVGYVSLFLVWVLIANINENKYEENVLLNSLFYYINLHGKSGKWRIIVHIVIQFMLLPLMFIIKHQKAPIDQDSFEQKRAIYDAISNFTFFIWLMTTVVASRF